MEMNFESTGEIDFFTAELENQKRQMEEEYQEELRQYYLQYPPDEYQNESTLAETE